MCRRLVLVLAVAACGGGGGGATGAGSDLEARLAADVARTLAVEVARVRCPAGPAPATCAAELAGGGAVELAITDDGDGTAWTLVGVVIATAPLVAEITAELADLGVAAQVDCGAPLRQAHRGARLDCALDVGGVAGAAWATIDDDDGGYRLEVALDPAAVAARTAEVDEATLWRTSEALDRDDAEGVGPEVDEGDEGDAGVPDAGGAPPDGAITRGSGT